MGVRFQIYHDNPLQNQWWQFFNSYKEKTTEKERGRFSKLDWGRIF